MKVNIIPIGTSKGVRIPKTVLTQCHVGKYVDMVVRGKDIILKHCVEDSREGWSDACKKMRTNKDDKLLIGDNIDLDAEDWQW